MKKEVLIFLTFVLFVPFVNAEANCVFALAGSPPGSGYAPIQFLYASGMSGANLSLSGTALFPYRVFCPTSSGAIKFVLINNQTDSVGNRADFGSLSGSTNATFQRPSYPALNGYIAKDLATFFYDPTVLRHACYVRDGGCLPLDSCVMSISGDTNASVGDCSVYNSKLCCDVFATSGCIDTDGDGFFNQAFSNASCSVSNWDCGEGIYNPGTDSIDTDPADCNPQANIDCGNPIFSGCARCIYPGAFENTYPLCHDGVDNDCDTFYDYPDDPDCNIPVQALCGDGVINAEGEQCEYPGDNAVPFNQRDLVSCPDMNGIEPLQSCNSQCKCEYFIPNSGNYSVRYAGECTGVDDNGIGTSQDVIKVYDRDSGSVISEYNVNSTRPCLSSQVDEPFFGINSLIVLITLLGGYYLLFHKKDEN